jgi:hydroxymethylglutaryl-CoA reductase (NADPH)
MHRHELVQETLPNLTVGTVGGTGLPSQRACLAILGVAGAGNSSEFAEVCAGLCLAGELSLTGALAANQFARAHQRLARARRSGSAPQKAAIVAQRTSSAPVFCR